MVKIFIITAKNWFSRFRAQFKSGENSVAIRRLGPDDVGPPYNFRRVRGIPMAVEFNEIESEINASLWIKSLLAIIIVFWFFMLLVSMSILVWMMNLYWAKLAGIPLYTVTGFVLLPAIVLLGTFVFAWKNPCSPVLLPLSNILMSTAVVIYMDFLLLASICLMNE